MKKLVTFVIALALILSNVAFASNIDLGSLTDEELDALIKNAIFEQWLRKADNYMYYKDDWDYKGDDGLSIRLRNFDENYGTIFFSILEVDNDTDEEIRINPIDARLNGWDIDCSCFDRVSAHGKKRCRISFDISQAGIDDPNEIYTFNVSYVIERARDSKELYTIGPFYYSR